MRLIAVLPFVVLSLATAARGQTTRPAAPATPQQVWARTVEGFAKALVAGDLNGVNAALAPRASIRRFEGNANQEAWRLFERLEKSTLVGQHAYLHPPLVMAADVASDFKGAAVVPDDVKARFIIDDEAEIKRANATAVQWVGEQLAVKNGAPVAVIVLWTQRVGAAAGVGVASEKAQHDVVFVLCRGEEGAVQGQKIKTVVYGVPVAEGRE
jgi:hypothetical protein